MIITKLKNCEYPDSYSTDAAIPIDGESVIKQLRGIKFNDSNIVSYHVVKIRGKVSALCALENSRQGGNSDGASGCGGHPGRHKDTEQTSC